MKTTGSKAAAAVRIGAVLGRRKRAELAICAVTVALLRRRTGTLAPAPVLPDQLPPANPGMIPLTVPETGRPLGHPPPPDNAGYWLDWRRGHQARSHWYHQRTRLARRVEITLVR